jgi:hypothetical protein
LCVYINVVVLAVGQHEGVANGLDVLHFHLANAVNEGRHLHVFVQVLERPDILQVVGSHDVAGVLGVLFDLRQSLRVNRAEVRASAQLWQKSALGGVPRKRVFFGRSKGHLIESACILANLLELSREGLGKLLKAVINYDFQVIELLSDHVGWRRLVDLVQHHVDVDEDDLLPLARVKFVNRLLSV